MIMIMVTFIIMIVVITIMVFIKLNKYLASVKTLSASMAAAVFGFCP